MSFVTGTGLTHLGSAEGRDRMHKDLSEASTLTNSMRMFKLGLEGGKPGKGQAGVQPEWFYKGDGSTIVCAGERSAEPGVRPRRRRGARDRRGLSDRRKRRAGPPRISRSATNFPITSPNGGTTFGSRIPSCAHRASGRNCWWGICRATFRASREFAAARRSSGRSPSCPASRTWPIRSPISRRITSSMRCFGALATSTCISLGLRPCHLAKACGRKRATFSRSQSEPFGLPLRNRLGAEATAKAKVRAL